MTIGAMIWGNTGYGEIRKIKVLSAEAGPFGDEERVIFEGTASRSSWKCRGTWRFYGEIVGF